MIGHYLLTLTSEQEDRILTEVMRPYQNYNMDNERCLVDVADELPSGSTKIPEDRHRLFAMSITSADCWKFYPEVLVGVRYDDLCRKNDVARINAAIRTRILSNRAYRALTAARTQEVV
jgi:hypothetical protein